MCPWTATQVFFIKHPDFSFEPVVEVKYEIEES